MKRKIAISVIIAAMIATIFAGAVIMHLTDSTAGIIDGNEGRRVEEQDIDEEDIFSDRDLNNSPDTSGAISIKVKNDSVYTINCEGIYLLTGQGKNFTVKVEADKKDKVQIVLKDVEVENEDFPIIYVKSADKCFITSKGKNQFTVSNKYTADGDINTDAAVFSKADLTMNGDGLLTIISSMGNGITSKDDLKIAGGKYDITCDMDGLEANDGIYVYEGEIKIKTNKDGLHCKNDKAQGEIIIKNGTFNIDAKDDGIQANTLLTIDGGKFDIKAAEGLEATYIIINGGNININASDDGINASAKSDEYDVVIEINGGNITVVMGAGDTDALDANGSIVVNGGTIDITGQSAFDYDREAVYNGGTIIINGETVDNITQSMMGGHGGGKREFGGQLGKPHGEIGTPHGEIGTPHGEIGTPRGELGNGIR